MSLKIIHISFEDSGGAGLCAYRICKAQRQMGLDSKLIVLSKKHKDDFVIRYGSISYFLHRVANKFRKSLNILNDECRAKKLSAENGATYTLPVSSIDLTGLQIIREADIVHLHWTGNILDYPSFFRTFKDKPIVWTLHDENLFFGISHYSKDSLPGNALEKKYYRIKSNSVRSADNLGIVFLSRMLQSKFGNHEMVSERKQAVIHNSVDSRVYVPRDKEMARKRLGIPFNSKLFAFCAANIFDKRKGLEVLSETLMRMNPEYRVLAVGNNHGSPSKHWPNVIETGSKDTPEDLSLAFSAADYYVMPSYQEAFAQTPIEAMSCGLPVIAFPCSGMEELITPANGIKCEDFSSDALEKGIRQAMACAYSREDIRRDVIDRFSPERIAASYISFYRELLSSRKRFPVGIV